MMKAYHSGLGGDKSVAVRRLSYRYGLDRNIKPLSDRTMKIRHCVTDFHGERFLELAGAVASPKAQKTVV